MGDSEDGEALPGELATPPVTGPMPVGLDVVRSDIFGNRTAEVGSSEVGGIAHHEAFPLSAAYGAGLPDLAVEERGDRLDAAEASTEKNRDDGQAERTRNFRDSIPREETVVLPNRKDAEGRVLRDGRVLDGVDSVQVFAVDCVVVVGDCLPSVVLLDHPEPRLFGLGGDGAGEDASGMETGVSAVQFLRHYHFPTYEPGRVRVGLVIRMDAGRLRPVRGAGIFGRSHDGFASERMLSKSKPRVNPNR